MTETGKCKCASKTSHNHVTMYIVFTVSIVCGLLHTARVSSKLHLHQCVIVQGNNARVSACTRVASFSHA